MSGLSQTFSVKMEIIHTEFCVQNPREHSAVRKMGALAFL